MRFEGTLSETQSKKLLGFYGLPLTKELVVQNSEAANKFQNALQNLVALKIQSPDIPHKTEANAIRLGVSGDLRPAYDEVIAAAKKYKPDARIEGVLIQEMVTGGHEILIGVSRDPVFGPVLTVGLGGIYVEVLKDVAFRLPPIGNDEAIEMLKELRAYPLLAGVRGHPASDIEALADCIERISWLAVDLKDKVVELDINPLRVLPKGARVVDALVVAA
jgi:acetyltransferase